MSKHKIIAAHKRSIECDLSKCIKLSRPYLRVEDGYIFEFFRRGIDRQISERVLTFSDFKTHALFSSHPFGSNGRVEDDGVDLWWVPEEP